MTKENLTYPNKSQNLSLLLSMSVYKFHKKKVRRKKDAWETITHTSVRNTVCLIDFVCVHTNDQNRWDLLWVTTLTFSQNFYYRIFLENTIKFWATLILDLRLFHHFLSDLGWIILDTQRLMIQFPTMQEFSQGESINFITHWIAQKRLTKNLVISRNSGSAMRWFKVIKHLHLNAFSLTI